jgi:hypothetical protein
MGQGLPKRALMQDEPEGIGDCDDHKEDEVENEYHQADDVQPRKPAGCQC